MTNKIFLLAPHENWICDRFVDEWKLHHSNCVNSPEESDIIWCVADWCWRQIDTTILSKKRVVVTVHHLVPDKFGASVAAEFKERDKYVDAYHVPCWNTYMQVTALTNKPIFSMPFWVNGEIWKKSQYDKLALRKAMSIDEKCFLVGSFQRDTEGVDLISPKLEKGPDIFCDAMQLLQKQKLKEGVKLRVLLAGWRRQYVMNRLDAAGIEYYYAELPSNDVINNFYNCIDQYVVTSRYEGGPQAVLECAASHTSIISTNVGVAPEILAPASLFKHDLSDFLTAKSDCQFAAEKVNQYIIPNGFRAFEKMFEHRALGVK